MIYSNTPPSIHQVRLGPKLLAEFSFLEVFYNGGVSYWYNFLLGSIPKVYQFGSYAVCFAFKSTWSQVTKYFVRTNAPKYVSTCRPRLAFPQACGICLRLHKSPADKAVCLPSAVCDPLYWIYELVGQRDFIVSSIKDLELLVTK